MPIKKKIAKKPVVVNRKFLMRLADSIYNPKTRKFLRLCDGKLQNGPDPTDQTRPMHCGLGELYFAMTGDHPEFTGVKEEGVVDLAVELSPFESMQEEIRDKAILGIKKLNLSDVLEETLLTAVNNSDDEEINDAEFEFREIINDIPNVNDDCCGDDRCSIASFRTRSKRVAAKLREAAKLLPA